MEQAIKTIKAIRREIDTCINSIIHLAPSAEITLAKRELQRSKMWLGQFLGSLGTPDPYPESSDPTSKVIEDQAEHSQITFLSIAEYSSCLDQISKVKFFREYIQGTVTTFRKDIFESGEIGKFVKDDSKFFANESWLRLMESKMWLGIELNRIHESTKQN
jgi:hypothetical protein